MYHTPASHIPKKFWKEKQTIGYMHMYIEGNQNGCYVQYIFLYICKVLPRWYTVTGTNNYMKWFCTCCALIQIQQNFSKINPGSCHQKVNVVYMHVCLDWNRCKNRQVPIFVFTIRSTCLIAAGAKLLHTCICRLV